MSARRRVAGTIDGSVVIFQGWRVADLLRAADTKPIYAASAGGWMVDLSRLADVVAYLEYRNVAVTVTAPESASATSDSAAAGAEAALAETGGLW